jgi:hypothetical protein
METISSPLRSLFWWIFVLEGRIDATFCTFLSHALAVISFIGANGAVVAALLVTVDRLVHRMKWLQCMVSPANNRKNLIFKKRKAHGWLCSLYMKMHVGRSERNVCGVCLEARTGDLERAQYRNMGKCTWHHCVVHNLALTNGEKH